MSDRYRWTASALITSDTTVKSTEGYVKSIVIAHRGASAGEFVTLVNATSGASPDIAEFCLAAANGTITFEWAGEGLYFDTGIRINIGPTVGRICVKLQYK